MPRRLAAGSDVRCNHVVSAILRHRDGVEVITNRGVYSGNVAVTCLPGVLQAVDICFDPPLCVQAAAMDAIIAGTATKLVLCFRRDKKSTTFWPNTLPLLATSLATQLWWPTGWGYEDQRHFLASCLVGGAAVTRFTLRDPRRVGLAQLAHMALVKKSATLSCQADWLGRQRKDAGSKYSTYELRVRAVQAVQGGMPVTHVVQAYQINRATLHRWLARYHQSGGSKDWHVRPAVAALESSKR